MPIRYHEAAREFHLYNNDISYIIGIMPNEQLENLYYGKKIHNQKSFSFLHEEMNRALMTVNLPQPSELSMQYTRQEYPSYGTGDYREPAFTLMQENGSSVSSFTFACYRIYPGKQPLEGLPAVYVEDPNEAESLEITLEDKISQTKLILTYTIYADMPVIARSCRFEQKGEQSIRLERAMSISVDLPDMDYEMLHLDGAWSRERYVKKHRLETGTVSIGSMRGASSSEHNPFLALKRPNTTENCGEVFAFSLIYSGSFLAQAEVNTHESTRILMGIHPDIFSWELKPGEFFQTPEAVMVYTDKGLNHMSQTFHRLYRTRLCRGKWRDLPRPILLNNWEATFMNFDEQKILDIARTAKDAGIELFVLDDGWFGTRDDDTQSLGDWYPDKKKLPHGICGLSEKIEAMGMMFGLWIEPEMVNPNSHLYREHPDWILAAPNRFASTGRHQYVLDFSREEVINHICEQISGIIRNSSISYIKWDMNRYISECYSQTAPPSKQGKVMHKYILGVYKLYERLIQEFPNILFESCASGGARFDPGMLYYAPQTWASDDTDALERVKIQYGTSYVYPISSIGTHVSAIPNQQLMRSTPLETRANAAFFGTFGYELDLNTLTLEEFSLVKRQIRFMKHMRELIQKGTFYRLKNPFQDGDGAWMTVSENQTTALAAYYQSLNKSNAPWLRLKLAGLKPDAVYKVLLDEVTQGEYYGDVLMNAGIPIDRNLFNQKGGDFASILYQIEQIG